MCIYIYIYICAGMAAAPNLPAPVSPEVSATHQSGASEVDISDVLSSNGLSYSRNRGAAAGPGGSRAFGDDWHMPSACRGDGAE